MAYPDALRLRHRLPELSPSRSGKRKGSPGLDERPRKRIKVERSEDTDSTNDVAQPQSQFAGNLGLSALGTSSNPISLLDSPPPSAPSDDDILGAYFPAPYGELNKSLTRTGSDAVQSQSPLEGVPGLGTSSNPIDLDDYPSAILTGWSAQGETLFTSPLTSLHEPLVDGPFADEIKGLFDDIRRDNHAKADETIPGLAVKLRTHQQVPPPHN